MMNKTAKQVILASNILGISKTKSLGFIKPNNSVNFDIKLNNGHSYKAFRVQHSNKLGPYKGGIRFHHSVNLPHIKTLALLMALKTAAVGLPFGGAKGGVAVDPRSLSENELIELSRSYANYLAQYIGPKLDIPAPDVNTNSKIIDIMIDEYNKITGNKSGAAFTGKSVNAGGHVGRKEATGRGGAIVLREYLKFNKLLENKLTIGVEGLGNVGQYFLSNLNKILPKIKLVAVSDSSTALVDYNGLNIDNVIKHKRKSGLKNYTAKTLPSSDIIKTKCDILVLAALENSVSSKNAAKVNAKIILELANQPINHDAESILEDNAVVVIPDIIANAGGVVGSYLEWLQNIETKRISLADFNGQLDRYMSHAAKQMLKTANSYCVSLKTAAYIMAIKKLTT